MNDEFKIYNVSYFTLGFFSFIIIIIAIISIINFNLPHMINKIIAIICLICTLILIWFLIYLKNNPQISTTKDKIIISQGPIRKIIEINISNIDKIEKKSPTNMIIWHRNGNARIRKTNLDLFFITGDSQIEFNKYIDNIKKIIES